MVPMVARCISFVRMFSRPWSILIGAVLSVPLSAAAAQGRNQCRLPDFPAPILCARAGLDTVHASYLLLIDESGSMQPLWPSVRSALEEFASAIPEGDELDVRAFSGDVRSVIPPSMATPATRSSWQSRFRTLELPHGANTDLGAAARAALGAIASAPAQRIQFVFFLTDGRQDPAAGSPFSASWNSAWDSLAREAELVDASRPLSVGVVRLAVDADPTLLRRVFQRASVTDAMGTAGLRSWFASVARDVGVRKLRVLIDRELRSPAWTVSADGTLSGTGSRASEHSIRYTAQRRILDAQLTDSTAALPSGALLRFESQPLPGSSIAGRVSITGPPCAWWKPPRSCISTETGDVPITARLQPSAELERIGIDPGPRPDSVRLALVIGSGGALPGYLYFPFCALVLAALVALFVRTKQTLHRPRLVGQLVVSLDGAGGSSEKVDFNKLATKRYSVCQRDGTELLRFEAKNERGRTVMYAVACQPGVTVMDRPVSTPYQLSRPTRFVAPSGSVQYLK